MSDIAAVSASCEWQRNASTTTKCGRPAKVYVVSPGSSWGRSVCGIHAQRAYRIGWHFREDLA